jgi:hypothetical protein
MKQRCSVTCESPEIRNMSVTVHCFWTEIRTICSVEDGTNVPDVMPCSLVDMEFVLKVEEYLCDKGDSSIVEMLLAAYQTTLRSILR